MTEAVQVTHALWASTGGAARICAGCFHDLPRPRNFFGIHALFSAGPRQRNQSQGVPLDGSYSGQSKTAREM